MTREGVVVPTGGYGRRNTRVLTVATVGRGFPNTPVLARQHPGLVVINTRVLATSTPGCCDAKRGVLERHRYIVDFQGVFFERTTDNNIFLTYIRAVARLQPRQVLNKKYFFGA